MKYKLITLLLLFCGQVLAHPLKGLLDRIDAGASKRIAFEIKDDKSGLDYFELSQKGAKPLIRANTYVNAAVGLNWYLKYYCGIHLSWNCMKSKLPSKLPKVEKTERHKTDLTLRYNFNYCTFSYSMPFWDWNRWEKEIDWMALHGINMPLAAVGHECVWRNMLLRMGYTEEEVGQFIAGPAFLAWWEMNNLEGWGGPLPLNWYKQQETLQKQILKRMKEYGMKPVLPGYSGMRPSKTPSPVSRTLSPASPFMGRSATAKTASGSKEDSKLTTIDYGEEYATDNGNLSSPNGEVREGSSTWNGFTRPGVIFPGDLLFDEYARLFYEETKKLYGTADYYSIDPFHEAKNLPEDLDIGEAGKEIMRAMKQYGNQQAKWVLQGWSENPRDEMIMAIEPGDLLILDLFSECRPQYGEPSSVWYREQGYRGHDWLFCMLENFGANIGMHGRMDQLVENFFNARRNFKTHMKGWGFTMEGSETNPIMYELMSELPWREESTLVQDALTPQFIYDYACARYGLNQIPAVPTQDHSDPTWKKQLCKVWVTLYKTIYNCPRGNNQQGPSESIFCSRPSLNSYQASSWSKMVPYYNGNDIWEAAQRMAEVADEMQKAYQEGLISPAAWDNFQYDLVDLCRQAIADQARITYHQAINDFKNFDLWDFEQKSQQFLDLLLTQDSLLATRPEFRVGRWIEQAKRVATNAKEARLYEWNARVQITTWGNRYCADTGKLRDYAHKEWNGLLRDFYYPRWKHFFSILKQELKGELPMTPIGNSSTKTDTNPAFTIDWYAMEEPWTLQHNTYGAEAEGDAVKRVKAILLPIEG